MKDFLFLVAVNKRTLFARCSHVALDYTTHRTQKEKLFGLYPRVVFYCSSHQFAVNPVYWSLVSVERKRLQWVRLPEIPHHLAFLFPAQTKSHGFLMFQIWDGIKPLWYCPSALRNQISTTNVFTVDLGGLWGAQIPRLCRNQHSFSGADKRHEAGLKAMKHPRTGIINALSFTVFVQFASEKSGKMWSRHAICYIMSKDIVSVLLCPKLYCYKQVLHYWLVQPCLYV